MKLHGTTIIVVFVLSVAVLSAYFSAFFLFAPDHYIRPTVRSGYETIGIIFVLLSLSCGILGVGLFRYKEWARITAITLGVGSAFTFSAFSLLFFTKFFLSGGHQQNSWAVDTEVLGALLTIALASAAMAFYLRSAFVRHAFRSTARPLGPSLPRIIVLVLCALLFFWVPISLFGSFRHVPFFWLGMGLKGGAATAVSATLACFYLSTSLGLLRRIGAFYYLAIGGQILDGISLLLILYPPYCHKTIAFRLEQATRLGRHHTYMYELNHLRFQSIFSSILAVFFIWALWRDKSTPSKQTTHV